jgi:hypothetical protein
VQVSPSFRAAPWDDRMIHCMVCCVLPLAVSDDPHCQLNEINLGEMDGIDGSIHISLLVGSLRFEKACHVTLLWSLETPNTGFFLVEDVVKSY